MDSTLYKKYKFSLSPEIEEKLRGDACFNFVKPILGYIYEVYPELLDGLPDDVQQICNLDPQLTLAAIHSAYIDLWQAERFHDLKGGPSPVRMAAAVTCWINRFKPIQFTKDTEDSVICLFLNSIFALETGWSLKLSLENEMATPLERGNYRTLALAHIKEVITEGDRGNILVYALMWRNPSFRELVTLFEFVK